MIIKRVVVASVLGLALGDAQATLYDRGGSETWIFDFCKRLK